MAVGAGGYIQRGQLMGPLAMQQQIARDEADQEY